MYILKQHIERSSLSTNKVINNNIYIENFTLYINNGEFRYKYENNCWYIKAGENWINMQGGIPNYSIEVNLDENLFMFDEK